MHTARSACWEANPPPSAFYQANPLPSACWQATPLPRGQKEWMTHTCEHITLPQTSFAGGKYRLNQILEWLILYNHVE